MRVNRVGRLLVALGVVGALLAIPAAAQARTDVTAGPGGGIFTGWHVISLNQTAGESSSVNVTVPLANWVRIATGNGHVTGGGCRSIGGGSVECPYVPGATLISAALNDKADWYSGTLPVWVDGGAGPDVIYGTGSPDVLVGGIGDDNIHAGAGNDFLFGGDGNDKLWGDGGSDQASGEAGNDVLHMYDNVHNEKVDCGAGASDKSFADKFISVQFPGDSVVGCETKIWGRNS